MSADSLADKEPLDIARDIVEHTDYLVSIDALLNGDERIVAKLARALLAMHEEIGRMREVEDAATALVQDAHPSLYTNIRMALDRARKAGR